MIASPRRARRVLAVSATAAMMAIAGCGNDDDAADDLKQQGQELQQDSEQLRKEASKQLEAKTEALKDKAKETTQDALDAVKDNSNLTDEQKKQIEDAQKQLDASP